MAISASTTTSRMLANWLAAIRSPTSAMRRTTASLRVAMAARCVSVSDGSASARANRLCGRVAANTSGTTTCACTSMAAGRTREVEADVSSMDPPASERRKEPQSRRV